MSRRRDPAPPGSLPEVVFFARVRDPRLLELIEFYREDLACLRAAGFPVQIETRVLPAVRASGDVLYAWWWHSSFPVVLAWRLRGRRAVVTGTVGAFGTPGQTRFRRWLRRMAVFPGMAVANLNLAISGVEFQEMVRRRVPRAQLGYLGVDTGFFQPGPKALSPSAVTVGQINAPSIIRKGIDTAIRAAALVRQSIPDFTLRVIGPVAPDGQAWLDEERARTGMPGVEILGEQDREAKRRWLAEAWVYLQASRYEGFGMAVAEAMACGTVPVVTPAGSLPEVVGDAGIFLSAPTPESLAALLVELLGDQVRLQQLSGRAVEQVAKFGHSVRRDLLAQAVNPSRTE